MAAAALEAEYSEANGFTSQDWVAATERLQENRVPKLNQFEAYLLQAQRKRQGEVRVKPPATPFIGGLKTNYLWNGQQVFKTLEAPMGMWTLEKFDGTFEQYLSDRPPTMAEQQGDKILAGPRAGCKLLGSDAVYRAGVYVERDNEVVFDALPSGWRTRPECTTLPRTPRTQGTTRGFTRLGDVKVNIRK